VRAEEAYARLPAEKRTGEIDRRAIRIDIDPRIAATGGNPVRGGKGGYIWPGMVPLKDWQRTRLHQHTNSYSCGRCGQAFNSPHAVYTHMAKRHGR
jgi:hypothetical protein